MPLLDEVMLLHRFVLPPTMCSIQLRPESSDVQMFSPYTTAASLVPSLEEVMCSQSLDGAEVRLNEFAEFVEIHMPPPFSTAATLVPSLEEAMPFQYLPSRWGSPTDHEAPELNENQI